MQTTDPRLEDTLASQASAAREGQRVSLDIARDMEACARGEITSDDVRRRVLARLKGLTAPG